MEEISKTFKLDEIFLNVVTLIKLYPVFWLFISLYHQVVCMRADFTRFQQSVFLQVGYVIDFTYRLTSCFMSLILASRGQHFLLL